MTRILITQKRPNTGAFYTHACRRATVAWFQVKGDTMSHLALYDVLHTYQDIHKTVLSLATV